MIYSQNNVKIYPQCSYSDLKKLEDTLGIGIGGLSIKKSDKELEMYYDYYRSSKGLNTGNKISTTSKAAVLCFSDISYFELIFLSS